MTEITFTIADDPPRRLDKALARDVPVDAALSRTALVRLIGQGAVTLDGVVVTDAKAAVHPGATVRVTVPQAAPTHMEPEDIALEIAHEDDDLIVINKPAGMVVHPAPGTPSGTLVNALLHHFGGRLSGVGGEKRPGIVHRIDKDTSGLLVVAKSDAAHQGLAAQFAAHSAERLYRAICYGVPDAGDPRLRGIRGTSFEGQTLKITTGLARHKTDRQRQAVVFGAGRHAVTRVRAIARFGTPPTLSEVECRLETGRTHQIRVHMAHVGHALIGDPVYGGRRKIAVAALSETARHAVSGFGRQALHAAVLGFDHPLTGEALRFEAPLAEDMSELVRKLHSGA